MTRAFVVGNGPSLMSTNLDLMVDDVTLAMNRYYLIYNEKRVLWKPTFFFLFDYTGDTWQEDVRLGGSHAQHSVIRGDRAAYLPARSREFSWPPRMALMDLCSRHVGMNVNGAQRGVNHVKEPPTGWHLPELCGYAGTMNIALQAAVVMELNPIYIIGCDLGYTGVGDHFVDEYETFDDLPIEEKDDTLIHMHSIAKREAESRGIKIYNATIGGELEVYERVNYEELFT